MKHGCGETLEDLEPVYDLFPIINEFALPEAVTQTYMGRFLWNRTRTERLDFTVNRRRTLTSREPNW